MTGRFEEAIAGFKRAVKLDPASPETHIYLGGFGYYLEGHFDEAIAQADKVLSAWPTLENAELFAFVGWVYALSGRQEDARNILNRMLDSRAKRYVDPSLIGAPYAGLREKDKAFERLTKAYRKHAGQIVWIKVDPWIKNLRSDPRY